MFHNGTKCPKTCERGHYFALQHRPFWDNVRKPEKQDAGCAVQNMVNGRRLHYVPIGTKRVEANVSWRCAGAFLARADQAYVAQCCAYGQVFHARAQGDWLARVDVALTLFWPARAASHRDDT